jgi:hypothetical protein
MASRSAPRTTLPLPGSRRDTYRGQQHLKPPHRTVPAWRAFVRREQSDVNVGGKGSIYPTLTICERPCRISHARSLPTAPSLASRAVHGTARVRRAAAVEARQSRLRSELAQSPSARTVANPFAPLPPLLASSDSSQVLGECPTHLAAPSVYSTMLDRRHVRFGTPRRR